MLSLMCAMTLLADWGGSIRTWSFIDFAKLVIIVIAVCAVVFVACKAMGVAVPSWLVQIGIIVVVAFVAIVAITMLASM